MKRRRSILAILGVFLILTGTCPVFAAGITTYRDGNIEFDVPNEWYFNEHGVEIEQYDHYEIEYILDASSEETGETMNMFYIKEPLSDTNSDYSMWSEESALEYYEEEGKTLLEYFCRNYWDVKGAAISSPEYYSGEWENLVRLNVEGDEGDEYIAYLSGKSYESGKYLVHALMIFEYAGSESDKVEMIVEGFDDYEYGEVLCGIRTMDGDWEAGESSDEESGTFDMLFTIGLPLIIGVVSIVLKIKDGQEIIDDEESEEDPFEQIAEKVRQREAKQAVRKAEKEQKKVEKRAAAGTPDKTKEKKFVFKKAVDDREIFKERSAKSG